MRNTLVLLAIVALLGGAALVILPSENGDTLQIEPSQDEERDDLSEAAGLDEPTQATAQLQPKEAGRVSAPHQASNSLARTLQVVDENGAALPGIRVYFADFGEAKWNDHFADMVAAPESLPPATALYSKHSAVSGLGGYVALPELPFTLAAARDAGQYGAVMVPPVAEVDASADFQLVLRSFSEAQVRVIDAQGQPVSDVAVTFEAASSKRLAREGRARGNPFGPWQQLDRAEPTDKSGVTRVMTSVPESRMQLMQMPIDQIECAIAIHHPAFGAAEKLVSWGSREEVEFRLPPSGEIQVTVVGFPDGTHPVLRRTGPKSAENIEGFQIASDMLVTIKLVRGSERRTYRFTHIPLGQEWRVDFRLCLTGEENSPHKWGGSLFDGGAVTGPTVANEVVEREFRRNKGFTFLVEFRGLPGEQYMIHSLNSVTVENQPTSQPIDWMMAKGEGGKLRIRLPLGTEPESSDLQRLSFQVSPVSSELHGINGQQRHSSAPLFAVVEVPQGPRTGEIDLGTVQLEELTQFFTVRVADAATGASIDGAWVVAEVGRELHPRSTSVRGLAHFSPQELGYPFSAVASFEGMEDRQFNIRVNHEDYAAASVEVSAKSGLIEVELTSAFTLTGIVAMPHWLPSARMILVESGKRLFDAEAEHSAQAFLRAVLGEFTEFSIEAAVGQSWDAVVFLEGPYNLELARFPKVERTLRRSVDNVDPFEFLRLEDHVDHLELSILLPSGAAWEPGTVDGQTMQVHQADAKGRLRERQSTWSQGQLHLAVGKGTSFTGELHVNGYQTVSLNNLAGGAHTIQLAAE